MSPTMLTAQRCASCVLIVGLLMAAPFAASADTTLIKEVAIDASRVAAAKTKPFTLTFGTRTWIVPASEVKPWFKTRTDGSTTYLTLRPDPIYAYLNAKISPVINQTGEQSRFIKVNGAIQLVEGGRKGTIVDGVKTSLAFRSALVAGKSTAAVSMKEYRPTVFSAEDFKKLSFPELLARGESNFAGSPKNRIHNIKVATAKYNGLVLLPNEEFSFNQYLGNVDAANGYLPELVIKENVTTPEFGGGICQVSTTAFRGAMQAGLKITSRRNHSYPVAYYGTPGYDATVYSPSPDVRFQNDTGKPVHIVTSIQGTKVFFEVWGTSGGRTVTINGPFVTERRPDGSLTAAVAQIVKKDGKSIREQNFVSRYQSPDKFPTVRKANGE
jgi:vancomycin resistance protein YoaR